MNYNKEKVDSNKQLFLFLFSFFWKTKIGPIISIALPWIFMFTYFAIMNFNNDTGTFAENLALYISLTIIPLSLITIPQVIVDLKNSILLRKIKTSGFSKINFIAVIFCLYFLMSILFLCINFIMYLALLLTRNDYSETLSSFYWGRILFSIFYLIIISIALGIFLGSLFKNLLSVQITGIIIFLFVMSLSGMFIPLELTSNVLFLKIVSTFSPINYCVNLLINSIKVTDDGTFKAILSILNNKEETETVIAFKARLKELNIDINLEPQQIINQIKAGHNIFNCNAEYYLFFQLGSLGNLFNFQPTDGVKILSSWQKYLNLIMPNIFIILLTSISIKYFSWYGR